VGLVGRWAFRWALLELGWRVLEAEIEEIVSFPGMFLQDRRSAGRLD